MRRWAAFPLRLYVTAACVCLLAPIFIVVILAFSGDGYLHFPPTSLSLQWFARFFGDLQWQHALLSSLAIGAIACLVSTTVGFFAAYVHAGGEHPRRPSAERARWQGPPLFERRLEPGEPAGQCRMPDRNPQPAEFPSGVELGAKHLHRAQRRRDRHAVAEIAVVGVMREVVERPVSREFEQRAVAALVAQR